MRTIFVLLLAVTLSVSATAFGASDASQPKKQEQRKSKKADQINRVFEILKSGRFKIEHPLTREDVKSVFFGGTARSTVELDIADKRYEVRSAKIDSVKSVYTLDFVYKLTSDSYENHYMVIYNFRTGYLCLDYTPGYRDYYFEGTMLS